MARVRLGRFPSTEGQLARLALEQESIEVELIGEQLSALQGAIPTADAMVELRVEAEQLERAQRILATAFQENARPSGDVQCPSCGKSNPGNFDACWSCQAPLSGAQSVPAEAGPEAPKQRPPIFAALFACTTILFAGLLWKERQLAKYSEPPNIHYRWASESCLVQEINGHLSGRSCDYDRNDTFEQHEGFDLKGRHSTTAYDANQDGVIERLDTLDSKGQLVRRDFDLDGDWRFDRSDFFDANERLEARGTDLDGDGRFDRTEEFDAGVAN